MPQLSMHSPVGTLTLSEEDGRIVALDEGWGRDQEPTSLLREGVRQIHEYFDRGRTTFDLPLAPAGSAFRLAVWDEIGLIPFGATRRRADIAASLRSAPSAIGRAVRANPIRLLIPSHRVSGRERPVDAARVAEMVLLAFERDGGRTN